jgi:hypothetical protein
MADHDELLARADQWLGPEPGDDGVELIRGLAAALRAALAAQPQLLFEGSGNAVHAWLDTRTETECAGVRAVVYPAAAGSATPSGDDDG